MTPRQKLLQKIKGNPDLVERLLVVADSGPEHVQVLTPLGAYLHLAPLIAGLPTEHLAVLALDGRRRVIAREVLTQGNDQFTVVCPRQIFRWALLQGRSGAAAIILGHNHPSGDATPSHQDWDVTRRVHRAGGHLNIQLLDHLVLAGKTHTSMAELPDWPAVGSYA